MINFTDPTHSIWLRFSGISSLWCAWSCSLRGEAKAYHSENGVGCWYFQWIQRLYRSLVRSKTFEPFVDCNMHSSIMALSETHEGLLLKHIVALLMFVFHCRAWNCSQLIKMNLNSVKQTCKSRRRNLKKHKEICKKPRFIWLKKNMWFQFWKTLNKNFMAQLARLSLSWYLIARVASDV